MKLQRTVIVELTPYDVTTISGTDLNSKVTGDNIFIRGMIQQPQQPHHNKLTSFVFDTIITGMGQLLISHHHHCTHP